MPQRQHSVEALDQAGVEHLRIGDGRGVDVHPECAGVDVAEQGHADRRPDRRAEGVLLGHRGAAQIDRDRHPGHVAGQHVDVQQHLTEYEPRQQVQRTGDQLGQRQQRSARTCATRRWISTIRSAGSASPTG